MAKEKLQTVTVNPYTLPSSQHGWRGLGAPGNRRRKVYTLLQNDQVLVTALLIIPGDWSVRHSHGSAELGIRYVTDMRPVVAWHPAGEVHGGMPEEAQDEDDLGRLIGDAVLQAGGDKPLGKVLARIAQEQQELHHKARDLATSEPRPIIMVDIIFPPFTTTIHDPAYPEGITTTGQWYD